MSKSIRNPLTLVAMFLVPGLLVAAFYAICVRPIVGLGLPKTAAVGAAALFVLVPVELGIIYYQSHRLHGSFSISKMIPYDQRLALRQYALWCLSWFFGQLRL